MCARKAAAAASVVRRAISPERLARGSASPLSACIQAVFMLWLNSSPILSCSSADVDTFAFVGTMLMAVLALIGLVAVLPSFFPVPLWDLIAAVVFKYVLSLVTKV